MSEARHKPTVAWRTITADVSMIDSSTYQVIVVPYDTNDVGQGQKQVGYYITDFVGHCYSISDINIGGDSTKIEIKDVFEFGVGPQSGQMAIVYKSVGSGKAPYLAPIYYRFLDSSAEDIAKAIELDILFTNKGDADTLIGLTSRDVSVSFANTYTAIPTGAGNTKAYRIFEEVAGKPVMQTVLFHSLVVNTLGFSLTIDDSESLTGVIIEYDFKSAT